jgi:DNA polymerase/3'-5' exonuclease PolX
MTATEKRPLNEVYPIAEQVKASLTPYCRRIEIAGSIRRHRPMVGDIEIVAIPKTYIWRNLLNEVVKVDNYLWNFLDEQADKGNILRGCWGDIYRSFEFYTRQGHKYKVDVFTTAEDAWGSKFTIRTGSQEFSKWLVTNRNHCGALPNHLYHDENRLKNRRTGQVHLLFEERDFFDVCEIPFIMPEMRDDSAWIAFLEEHKKVRFAEEKV